MPMLVDGLADQLRHRDPPPKGLDAQPLILILSEPYRELLRSG